ncbi:MAG: xanthine dehydrogenase family protein molybdopterin-binding subunit [Caulobacter sp.]
MNAPTIPPGAAARFVGERVPRKEDARLLTGRGVYVDDITVPGMLQAAFVRSPIARGKIRSIDTEAARALPGVWAVFTLDEIAQLAPSLPPNFGAAGPDTLVVTPLASGRVAHVGEPIAIVVADDRHIAEDAVALVSVDYEIEEPVVTMGQAADSSPIHAGRKSNVSGAMATPDDPQVAAAFAGAAHVVSGTIVHQRQAQSPMETRGVVCAPQGSGEVVIYGSCQGPHMWARYFNMTFNMPETHFRVVSKDVGGAFGLKVQPWREEVSTVAASLLLRRPVKWIEDRLENLISACQAREQEMTVKLAFDADAKLLAAELEYHSNVGAWPQMGDANGLAMQMFPGPYRLPKIAFNARSWYSNTAGLTAYRGPWMIETLAREVMMDKAARQIGIDPVELRRRNVLLAADQPHSMPTGPVLDRVTPKETMELALEKLDLQAFRAEQQAARAEGRYLGMGLSVYVEPTTMSFGPLTSEAAQVRVQPNGKVSVVVTTHSQGHGTQTTMAQIVAEELGVPIEDVTVLEDDSTRGGFGGGAAGSRQAVAGGGAVLNASRLLAGKIKRIAGHMLNANPDDITLEQGQIRVAGVAEVTASLRRIAEVAYYEPDRLPPDTELGLEAQHRFRGNMVFSNAAHICVCEVNVETGQVKILRWIASEDCGVMINPAIVEGQIAGGIAQGIGGVLLEQISYDGFGNPTAVTFKDYLLPTAHDVPMIEYCHMITPSSSDGGFKGVGEGGAIVGPPALVNAITDALSPFGVECMDLPLTPAKLFRLIEQARGG